MHVVLTALLVFVAWTVLALPVAMFVGRFLRAGGGTAARDAGSAPRNTFGNAA